MIRTAMLADLVLEPADRERVVAEMYGEVVAGVRIPALFAPQPRAFADLPLLRRAIMRGDGLAAVCAAVNQDAAEELCAGRPSRWLLRHGSGWSGDGRLRVSLDAMRAAPLAAASVEPRGDGFVLRAVGPDGGTAEDDGDDAVWLNPRLLAAGGRSIALDVESPLAHELLESRPELSLLDEVDARALLAKLETALAVLRAVWPEMERAVGRSVSTIVASTTTVRDGARVVRQGSTTASFPALVFMNDYHCPSVSVAQLVENIVHEAMHNIIVDHELVAPWYDPAYLDQMQVPRWPTPWTSGRVLSFFAIYHSLFVFTAVGEWYVRAETSDVVDDATRAYARKRLDELGRRFAGIWADRARFGLADPPLSPRGRAWFDAYIDHPGHWSRGRGALAPS